MYSNGSFDIKINAKLFCTSNNAIAFDEDDNGILRRIQYCLHENRFVNDADLQFVDNVHVFASEPLDLENLDVSYRLAMFFLIVSFAYAGPVERPDDIYDGATLFDVESSIGEYFDLEEGEKVTRETVAQLARGYFHMLEFKDDFIVSKLVKYTGAYPPIAYDKNRSQEGSRGVLISICLNDKVRKQKKGYLSPALSAASGDVSVDWRARFAAVTSDKKSTGFSFGGTFAVDSAEATQTVFSSSAFSTFGSFVHPSSAKLTTAKPSRRADKKAGAVEDVSGSGDNSNEESRANRSPIGLMKKLNIDEDAKPRSMKPFGANPKF
ncbi:MAG: hypothetical protein EOP04_13000 [Proteobacteria bacterium]|nr:MAG: hypothetical protein EOP04_13000 [Pseudomonadota bacterium]